MFLLEVSCNIDVITNARQIPKYDCKLHRFQRHRFFDNDWALSKRVAFDIDVGERQRQNVEKLDDLLWFLERCELEPLHCPPNMPQTGNFSGAVKSEKIEKTTASKIGASPSRSDGLCNDRN